MILKDQKRWKMIREEGEYLIKGKLGQVALYRDGHLDVWICDWTNTDMGMVRAHRRAVFVEKKGWKAKQHYDDGALFVRHFSDLDRACFFIKARKRRQVTEAMRERGRQAARHLRSYEEKAGQGGVITTENAKVAQEANHGI